MCEALCPPAMKDKCGQGRLCPLRALPIDFAGNEPDETIASTDDVFRWADRLRAIGLTLAAIAVSGLLSLYWR